MKCYAWVLRLVTNAGRRRSEREVCPQLTPRPWSAHRRGAEQALDGGAGISSRQPTTSGQVTAGQAAPQMASDGVLAAVPRSHPSSHTSPPSLSMKVTAGQTIRAREARWLSFPQSALCGSASRPRATASVASRVCSAGQRRDHRRTSGLITAAHLIRSVLTISDRRMWTGLRRYRLF